MGTKDSALDHNNQFDIDKLLAMDPLELSKLNKLFPEYVRRYGPSFTNDCWNECLEVFFLKAHLFDKEKAGGKFFGFFNTLVYHEFVRYITYAKKRKRKIEYVYYEDTFSTQSSVSAEKENLPQESNKALVVEFDFDAAVDNPDGEPNKMDELIKKYAYSDEKEPLELYIRGAQITKEERALVIRFKNRVLRRIYRPEQLAELRKSKKHLSKNKRDVQNRVGKRNAAYGSEYKKMTKEERLELRLKKRAQRREENLKKFKETLSPKDYAEKVRQLEYYDMVREEANKKNIETQRKIRDKAVKEKAELRESIKKEQNGKIL
jgi:hypothetical protein